MTDGLIIGIDAGTSVIKSVAFATTGEQLAVAARPNAYESLAGGGVEQDMARTWERLALQAAQFTNQAQMGFSFGTISQELESVRHE